MNIDLNFIGLLLTIIALLLSVWQTLAARKQTKNLSVISNALSTRYLGEFPDYLLEIGSLMFRAKKEILIVSAIPCNGVFSSPDAWIRQKHAIELALNQEIEIKCVFAKKEYYMALIQDQFNEAFKNWDNWCNESTNKLKIHKFVKSYSENGSEDISQTDFVDSFEKAALAEMQSTYRNAKKIEVDQRPPMYMWIIDGKEAIFAVTTTIPSFSSEAFYTTDARLIKSLINIHNEYGRP